MQPTAGPALPAPVESPLPPPAIASPQSVDGPPRREAPIDRWMLTHLPGMRRHFVVCIVTAVATAAAMFVQVEVLARGIPRLVGAATDGPTATQMALGLGVVAVIRAVVAASLERSSTLTLEQFRRVIPQRVIDASSRNVAPVEPHRAAAVATDAPRQLAPYVSSFLPSMGLTLVVPAAATLLILTVDLPSALIIVATVPLIPIFMVLIGRFTARRQDRSWEAMNRLDHHFGDVLAGLPTLRLFGRAERQAESVRQTADRYRRSTMGMLRIAFLSALVLDLIVTLSVAIVAVEVGLRIASGSVTLASGLTVLLLVPEVYGPLRRVGANFHAAQDGRDAASDVRDLMDAETLPSGHAMPATSGTLSFNGVVVRVRTAESSQDGVGSGGSGPIGSGKHDDDIRDEHTGLAARGSARGLQGATVADRPAATGVRLRTGPTGDRLHATDVPMLDRSVEPGELAVMVGASGSGKSLLLDAVRGRCALRSGAVSWAGTDVRAFDAQLWAQRVAFIPQRPTPSRDTAAEVAGAGLPVSRDEVVRALGEVGLADFLDRPTDQLSGGERRRVMVAYAALAARHGAALVLADEPTAQLDDAAAELVIDSLAGIAARGVTVLAATHDPRLVAMATSTDLTPGVAATDSTSRSRADARSTAAVTDARSTAAVADARSIAAVAVAAEMTQAGVRQTSHSTRTPSTSEPRTPAPEAALSPSVDEAEAVQSRDTPPSLADLHRGENQSANQHAGAVSSEAAGAEAVSNEAISDEAAGAEAVSAEAASVEAISDKATSAEATSGRASTPLHRGTPQSSDEIPVTDRIAGLATVRSVLRRVGVPRTKLTLAVVAGFLADAATLGLAGVAAWLLLRASEHPSVSVLLVPAAIVRGCGTTKGLFRYGERLASHDAGLSVLGEVRSSLIGRLARVRPDRTTTLATAGRVRSTVHDVDGMLDLVVRAAVPWTTTIVSLVGAVAITSAIATGAGAIMACSAVLLAVVIPRWVTHSEVGGIQLRRHAERELASTVSDAAANIELHVDRGTVDVERRRVMAVVDRLDAVDAARSHRRTLVAMLVAAIPPCTVALTAVVVDPASVSRGMFGVLMLWPFAVLELASGATSAADGLAEGVVAARGVADAFDIPTEVHDGDVCDPAEGAEDAEMLPLTALLVDQLRAQWTDESPSIGPVSFGGDGGDRITVEGPSGAGKSTLAAALVDYCPNDYDRFLVDGRDRSQVGGPGLRASVMWVDQQPWIADTTVAANLRIGHPDATDDELFEALGTVALDGWIRERPLGLNAPVGRNGSNLSGGEAHRLAIARASLAAHRTVVLDEPTSHLDAATERIMSERLDAALFDRFVITLAHSTDSGLHVRRHIRPPEQGGAQRQ